MPALMDPPRQMGWRIDAHQALPALTLPAAVRAKPDFLIGSRSHQGRTLGRLAGDPHGFENDAVQSNGINQ